MILYDPNKLFAQELAWITDVALRNFTTRALTRAPEYFWTVRASLSCKFHPADEWTPGGLVLHTRRVAACAKSIAEGWRLSYGQKNALVAAALLHDVCKYGPHAHERAHLYDRHAALGERLVLSTDADAIVPRQLIARLVARHMGPYGPGDWSPDDATPLEIAVYTADWLASRPALFENGAGRRSWTARRR